MRLKFVFRVVLSCLIVVFWATGCASTDESVKARIALLELKLDALEEQQGGKPLEVDKVTQQEAVPAVPVNNAETTEVVNTIPGRAAVVPPSATTSAANSVPGTPNIPASSTKAPKSTSGGVVFLSQSAYADLTGARPVGVSSQKSIVTSASAGQATRNAEKQTGKKAQPSVTTTKREQKTKRSVLTPQKQQDAVAYEAALNTVLSGKTSEGRQKMLEFLERYPGSKLEPNALYWVGETWYSDKGYDKAILVFKDITTKFPKHDKASAALYKLGACYEQLKDKGNAHFYWQALVEDFPKSEAAALARKKLAVQ